MCLTKNYNHLMYRRDTVDDISARTINLEKALVALLINADNKNNYIHMSYQMNSR